MARVIYKFGGTSVGDTRRLYRAARRIAAAHRAGDEVVAVLSAQAGATDALLARGREIDPDCAGREADSLLSTGEQVSVSLCALALARLGVPAVSLCGWQMGLQTDGSHGSARVLGLRGDRIERELRAGRVVLAAGFQGVDAAGDITTLGRGGSDTTAVALAAFLHADLCRIYTDHACCMTAAWSWRAGSTSCWRSALRSRTRLGRSSDKKRACCKYCSKPQMVR